jgi:hypothetical protein
MSRLELQANLRTGKFAVNNGSIIIASWNVNWIRARLEHVKAWLTMHSPDVLLLQELKANCTMPR